MANLDTVNGNSHATAQCGYVIDGAAFFIRVMDPAVNQFKIANAATINNVSTFVFNWSNGQFYWDKSVKLSYIIL